MEEKELVRKIELLKGVRPSDDWVLSCRARLAFRMEMQRKKGLLTRDIFALKELFGFWPVKSANRALKPVYSLILAFMAISAGGSLTALAAMESMPGSALYPVKIGIEKLRLVASTQNSLPRAQSEFTARRLEELKAVVESQESAEKKTQNMERVVGHIQNQLITEKERLPKQEAKVSVKEAGERADQVKKVITQAKQSLPSGVKPGLGEKLTEVAAMAEKTSIQALGVMIQEVQTDEDKEELLARFTQILKEKEAEIAKLADSGKQVIGNSASDKISDKLPINPTVRAVLVNQSDEAKELLIKARESLQAEEYPEALETLEALNEILNGARKIAEKAVFNRSESETDVSGQSATSSSPVSVPVK